MILEIHVCRVRVCRARVCRARVCRVRVVCLCMCVRVFCLHRPQVEAAGSENCRYFSFILNIMLLVWIQNVQ